MICPLDFRYGRKEIKQIFSEESKLNYMLKVEGALARAHAKIGSIPKKAAEEISAKATTKYVTVQRVAEIEAEIKHDVMAIVKALSEQCQHGEFVHHGATSYDIVDTANALQIRDGLILIEKELITLINHMIVLADLHKGTVMLGRTHGQAALPITFGLKIGVYATELMRHLKRLRFVLDEISVGKMSGAVGTGAAFGDKFFEIQENVMNELNLKPEIPSTQIVGRDRYISLFSFLANLATSLEKYATEIRNLQRNEISEVAEFFEKKQVGSSTMPHKRNPIICEQICGLARIVRSTVLPTWENAIQWHERDLCNSSAERFLIPHSMVLTDWILNKSNKVFSTLKINPDTMLANIERANGLIFAESIMVKLVENGMSRQDAHELMRQCAMEAFENNIHLKEVLSNKSQIKTLNNLDNLFDTMAYTGKAEELVQLALENIRQELKHYAL